LDVPTKRTRVGFGDRMMLVPARHQLAEVVSESG
jgi:hypothetical protein